MTRNRRVYDESGYGDFSDGGLRLFPWRQFPADMDACTVDAIKRKPDIDRGIHDVVPTRYFDRCIVRTGDEFGAHNRYYAFRRGGVKWSCPAIRDLSVAIGRNLLRRVRLTTPGADLRTLKTQVIAQGRAGVFLSVDATFL